MKCNFCGNEFNSEYFDICPYCMNRETGQFNISEANECNDVDDNIISNQTATDEKHDELAIEKSGDLVLDFEDGYEVTEEDLIEEESMDDVVSIEKLGLSTRAVNALRRAKILSLDHLLTFLAKYDVYQIRNIGLKTKEEIKQFACNVRFEHLNTIKLNNESVALNLPLFASMSTDVDFLEIEALHELGLTKSMVSKLKNNGFHYCGELRTITYTELRKIVSSRLSEKLDDAADMLEKDIISLIEYVISSHWKEKRVNIFIRRARYETLQEIANNPNSEKETIMTRERVRQLEKLFMTSILPFVKELLFILKGSGRIVYEQELAEIFDDDEYNQILLYASKSVNEFEYLDFAGMFVEKNDESSIELKALDIISKIVGDGIDSFDNIDIINNAFGESGLDFLSLDAIFSLLSKHNYHIYDGYITKGKGSYSKICMHVIRKEFSNGIKLTQVDGSQLEDIKLLRNIVKSRYPTIDMPTSDRTLSSTLIRGGLILCDRGRYILEENVHIDEKILNTIKDYIDSLATNTIYYSELFSEFEGVLEATCGIDNYNYLHGVLSLYFPNEYKFYRDYMLKSDEHNTSPTYLSDRLYEYICEESHPVSKNILMQKFRGFNASVIVARFIYEEELLQWDFNLYTCFGLLDITENDIKRLSDILNELCMSNRGYTSEYLLFSKVNSDYPEFIQKNKIEKASNLFYIVLKKLSNKFDFRRPNISLKGKVDISATRDVALHLLDYPDSFSLSQYEELSARLGWSEISSSKILYDLENMYSRISIDEYMKTENFDVSLDVINRLKTIIYSSLDGGYFSLINMQFDEMPEFNYSWNEFIVESIVKKYLHDLDVIHPTRLDRRYQKGLIVQKKLNIKSYPEIVARKMKSLGYKQLSESKFLSFLIIYDLARKTIPTELSNSDFIKKEGDLYRLVDN